MAKTKLIDRLLFFLATRLGWLFVLFWGRLTRIEFIGREHFEWLKKNRKPFILCIWHGRLLLTVYLHRKDHLVAMVSEHRDGEMIAQTVQKIGFSTVRGSSTRGGAKASLRLLRILRQGGRGVIIPDGPNGPRHVFKPGALLLAQKSGAYLLLHSYASSRFFQFSSWDKFYVWKPFSRTVAIYSEPIPVPEKMSDQEFEQFRRQIEAAMIKQEEQADAYFRK